MATNVTAAWSTGTPRWRNVYKSPEEEQMWFDETLASGMVPYHHIIGGENGMGEDRRWLEPARKYFNWMARHDAHFVNRRSIANIGVVMGQRTHLFYRPPRGALMREYMDGLYYALLEGRFLFDFVHEDKLAPEDLAKYSALLLPNTALLSDKQCRPIARLRRCRRVAAGHLRDQPVHRAQPAAPRFRTGRCVRHSQEPARSSARLGNAYLARIEKQHEILSGFSDTNWIPGAENRVPVAPVDSPILTVVPGFVAYPPELSYPVQDAHERARRRRAPDAARAGWSISPATSSARCGVRPYRPRAAAPELDPLGRGRERAGHDRGRRRGRDVRVGDAGGFRRARSQLHESRHASRLDSRVLSDRRAESEDVTAARRGASRACELLRAEQDIPFTGGAGTVEFTIPRVLDYEVAAIYSS